MRVVKVLPHLAKVKPHLAKVKPHLAKIHKIADSWVAVVFGVLVTMGVGALLSPIVTSYLARPDADLAGAASAVPVLAGLAIASLLGGYAAGQIAKRRQGWHGALSGFAGLVVTGSYLIAGVAVQASFLGIDNRALPDFFPTVLTRADYHSVPALTLGFAGFPLQVVAAWIGGLLSGIRRRKKQQQVVVASSPLIADAARASAAPIPRAPTPL